MAITVTHYNFLIKRFLKNWIFFWKSWNRVEFTKLQPETKSRNSRDHQFWNHEMWGPPVFGKYIHWKYYNIKYSQSTLEVIGWSAKENQKKPSEF